MEITSVLTKLIRLIRAVKWVEITLVLTKLIRLIRAVKSRRMNTEYRKDMRD